MTVDPAPVWAALADPVRRAIVDRLREGPATTSDLQALVGSTGRGGRTGYGALHHLKVLREAGLVLVEARGRERLNHLNAARLVESTLSWLSPRQADDALRLNRLAALVRRPASTGAGTERFTAMAEINTFSVRQSLQIDADPATVFRALTRELEAWWGAPYLLIAEDGEGPTRMTVDLTIGGAVTESRGERSELWGVVSGLEPDRVFAFTGSMGMRSACTGEVRYELVAVDGGTRVNLSHDAVGAFPAERAAGYDRGWEDLNLRLQAWVEQGERYGVSGQNRDVRAG
ncbi:helix-turn-helix domain-containing protein [Tersicoccus sp. MR15.9]|uniref:helix-turn-helix domain-containing protein n=1 Tax=Tersicoccus mangrovi TaxID=3121635 RepID=UPI002FE6A917